MTQNAAQRSSQSGPFTGRRKTANLTPGAIGAGATVVVDFPFADAAVGDLAIASAGPLVDGIIIGAPYVATTGHVSVPFTNATAAPVAQTIIATTVGLNKQV